MKQRRFALAMALVFVLALAGCSANREESSAPVEPTDHISGGGVQNTPGMGGADHSPGMNSNDQNNDGLPDGSAGTGGQGGDSVMDDIGDAAGDLARGAGDAVRDAGDAIGDAARDVGRAVR